MVNAENGMYWIIGPREYKTNEEPPVSEAMLWTYYHAQNLNRSTLNFGRTATALRLTIHFAYEGKEEGIADIADVVESLNSVLLSYWKALEPTSQRALRERVGLAPPEADFGGQPSN